MNIEYGDGNTTFGPGININLTGCEVAKAIETWLVANGVNINGPRTITVNGELIECGNVYVDPLGFVITPEQQKMSGRGANAKVRSVEAVNNWNNRCGSNMEGLLLKKIIDWRELSDAGLRLRLGEMTAQEIRTVRAVLNALSPN